MKLLYLLTLSLMACAPAPVRQPTCEEAKMVTGETCPSDTIRDLEARLETLRYVLEVQVKTLQAAIDREDEHRNEIMTIIKYSHNDKLLAYEMLKAYDYNIATLFEVVENVGQQIKETDDYLQELKNAR